ncbi:bactofilin family protein [Novispirillum sp. DQ9]|uniref:bactofilin family protein n=1 Tax=Novispirillum sp. DQ9 TaxID=3398612 RepID=UPI003C7E02B4
MSAQSAPSSDHRPSRPGPSYLAPDLTVTGRIATTGDLEIDGRVDGIVDAKRLKVGPHGRVRASLGADDAVVSGNVVGVLKARGVTFTDGCRFEGEVQYEQLGMEPAAVVEGRMHPVISGNARTDIGQSVRTAPAQGRARPIPDIPRPAAAAEPAPPGRHPLLTALIVGVILIAAAAIGALYISPAARDWREALVDSVRDGKAPAAAPAPETTAPPEPATTTTEPGPVVVKESPAPAASLPKPEPQKPEPPKAEPPKPEPPKAEPQKPEPPKVEPPKAVPPKAEPPKAVSPAPAAVVPPVEERKPAPAPAPVAPAPEAVTEPKAPPPPAQTTPAPAVPAAAVTPSLPPQAPATPAPATSAPAGKPPKPAAATPTPAAAPPAGGTVRGGAKPEEEGCQWVKQCAPEDPERCVSVRRCDR